MKKPVIILLGKLPPPYMGPSIATEIILNSTLKDHCTLIHADTKAYDDLNELGKWSFKKIRRTLAICNNLRRLIKSNDPDIVWIPVSQTTTGFLKDALYIWIALISGKKVLIHLRGSNFNQWISNASFLTRHFVSFTLRKCSGVIVLGNKLRYLFNPYFREENIYVVPNGGNYVIPPKAPSTGPLRLLYLANLQASKGIEDVLKAIALIHPQYKEQYRLDVIGKWRKEETRDQCVKIIEDNNLNVSVHPPESGGNKLQFLANADIFLFPPREPEGHPWVIVEALAAGLPVISTDQGAITESVIHGINGFIVQPSSPAEIAERLKELINNPGLRQRMASESRKQYLNSFTEERMVTRLVTTFEHLLNK